MFGIYSLKSESVWILYPKVSEFLGVKSKHFQTSWDKIQILKRQNVESKHPKNKIQILKLQNVKSNHPNL